MRRAICRPIAITAGFFLGFVAVDCPTGVVSDTVLIATASADDDGEGSGGSAGAGGASSGGASDGGGGIYTGINPGRGRHSRLFTPLRGLPMIFPWDVRSRRAARKPARSSEFVLSGVDAGQNQAIRGSNYRVIAERTLSGNRGLLLRVVAPGRVPKQRALSQLRQLAPGRAVDENTIYVQRFRAQGARSASRDAFSDPLAAVDWRLLEDCRTSGPIGLVETGVDVEHPGLASKALETITVRSSDRQPSSKRHGTAVTTLLLGDGIFPGVMPSARVVAVDAFHSQNGQDQIDTFDLVSAIDVLVERGASIINLSLAGLANEVLDVEGLNAQRRGVVVVAASGNDGAAVKPRFPAAYPWAVAVTAVDKDRVVYRRAVRGPHIRFAAPGVGLMLRDRTGKLRQYTGTSFAAPFVAARLALAGETERPAAANAEATSAHGLKAGYSTESGLAGMTAQAVDLGEPGRDDVYGHGLVQFGAACRRIAVKK